MECSEVRLKLDEYIKNRLGMDVANNIMFHLEECQQCFEEMNMMKELNEILNAENPVYPGLDFTLSVMDKIERERVKSRSFTFSRFPVINLGASLILTGLLTIFINTSFINGAIKSCTDSMQYSAAIINTSISATTNNVETYITNIMNLGREIK